MGGRHRQPLADQSCQVERAAEESTSRSSKRRPRPATSNSKAGYDARNPQALKRLVANGVQLRPFSQPIMEACLKASNEVNAETSAANADYKKVLDSMSVPERRISVVAGRRVQLRHLHDPQPRKLAKSRIRGGRPQAGPFVLVGHGPMRLYNFGRTRADWIWPGELRHGSGQLRTADNCAGAGHPPKKPGRDSDETSSISQGRRCRPCRDRGRRAGYRAIDAGDQVAHDHKLAEVARHVVRRREIMSKAVAEATDNKFQIQTFAGGEIVRASRSSTRCRTARSKCGIPPRTTISARIRPSPSAPRSHSDRTRASTRVGSCSAVAGRCSMSSTRKIQRITLLAGNTGCQMGGWFARRSRRSLTSKA